MKTLMTILIFESCKDSIVTSQHMSDQPCYKSAFGDALQSRYDTIIDPTYISCQNLRVLFRCEKATLHINLEGTSFLYRHYFKMMLPEN